MLAHGLAVRVKAGFERVVSALAEVDEASNVYLRVLPVRPRVAVAVGEKYFLRAGNSLAATTIALEEGDTTILRVIVTGAREGLLDFFDLGASRDYARMVVDDVARRLATGYEVLAEVERLSRGKSSMLG